MTDNELNLSIARAIQYYIKLNNMTQAELAEKLGVSAQAVTSWCKGDKIPRMDKVDKMCEMFDIKRSQLIDPKEPQTSDDVSKAMELYKKYQALSPDKQAEFQHYLEYLQSKS